MPVPQLTVKVYKRTTNKIKKKDWKNCIECICVTFRVCGSTKVFCGNIQSQCSNVPDRTFT